MFLSILHKITWHCLRQTCRYEGKQMRAKSLAQKRCSCCNKNSFCCSFFFITIQWYQCVVLLMLRISSFASYWVRRVVTCQLLQVENVLANYYIALLHVLESYMHVYMWDRTCIHTWYKDVFVLSLLQQEDAHVWYEVINYNALRVYVHTHTHTYTFTGSSRIRICTQPTWLALRAGYTYSHTDKYMQTRIHAYMHTYIHTYRVVSTPTGECTCDVVNYNIAVVPILRSGLGLVEGFVYAYPNARVSCYPCICMLLFMHM